MKKNEWIGSVAYEDFPGVFASVRLPINDFNFGALSHILNDFS